MKLNKQKMEKLTSINARAIGIKKKKQPRRSRPCAYDDSNSPKDGSVRGCRLYKKGKKSAIAVARQFGGRKRNFNGEKLWARGYAV